MSFHVNISVRRFVFMPYLCVGLHNGTTFV
jgi:hypothetical protein